MNLIVSAAIVLLNPYVTIYISYKIPPFALSVHIPDVSTSIYVEVDSKVLLGLPFAYSGAYPFTFWQHIKA